VHDVGVQLSHHVHVPLGADRLTDLAEPLDECGQHAHKALDHHLVVVDQHDAHRTGLGNTLGPG
jgi:hypothetical protein